MKEGGGSGYFSVGLALEANELICNGVVCDEARGQYIWSSRTPAGRNSQPGSEVTSKSYNTWIYYVKSA